jgi:hypothetical protein
LRTAAEIKLTTTPREDMLNFGSDISKIQVLHFTAAANCVVKIVFTLNGSERGKEQKKAVLQKYQVLSRNKVFAH